MQCGEKCFRPLLPRPPRPPHTHLVPTGPWLTPRGVTPLRSLLTSRAIQNLSTAHHSEPQHSSPPQEGAVAPVVLEARTALCRPALAAVSLKGLLAHFTLIEHPGCPEQSWAQGSWS